MVDIIKLKSDGRVDIMATVNGEKKVIGYALMEPVSNGKHIAHVKPYVGMEHYIFCGFSIGEFVLPKKED